MHGHFHREITTRALSKCFCPQALETIIKANLGQDGFRGQLGHPEYHFDNNRFTEGREYIGRQREIIFDNFKDLKKGESFDFRQEKLQLVWKAFGRLIHAAQDFYAHSNYVILWLDREQTHPGDQYHKIPVEDIDPLDSDLLFNSMLRSGQIYFPWDYLNFCKPLEPLIKRYAPLDSHTHMNLDSPISGPHFAYVYVAALKRTCYESDSIMKILPKDLVGYFTGSG